MKRMVIMSIISLFMTSGCAGIAFGDNSAPKGWFKAGSHPSSYEVGLDSDIKFKGRHSGFIKSTSKSIDGFGTIMQSFKPKKLKGKRVRLSAFIKTKDVTGKKAWAGLWMRVDGQSDKSLSFDNMQDRPITGTKDWKKYSVVLKVPDESTNIAFGVLLSGTGEVWLDDLKIESVNQSVPLTQLSRAKQETIWQPVNLGFES